jgi:hypothetical protein
LLRRNAEAGVREQPALPTYDMLDLVQAADHLRLLPETFSALVRANVFPRADAGHWHAHILDRIVEALLQGGLPNNQRLPYSHPVRRRVEDGPARLHQGWRHGNKSKSINQPFHSPAYICQWFELERDYAAEQTAQTKRQPIVDRPSPSSPPLALTSTAAAACGSERAQEIPPAPERKLPRAPKLPMADSIVPTGSNSPVYLTPEELCERWRWRITPETLANHRAMKIGLPYCKFGKIILYRLDLIKEYEQQHLVHPA